MEGYAGREEGEGEGGVKERSERKKMGRMIEEGAGVGKERGEKRKGKKARRSEEES